MYNVLGGSTVAGVAVTAATLPEAFGTGPAATVAQTTLAVTGVAAGTYVALALVLIIIGFVLRRIGTSQA